MIKFWLLINNDIYLKYSREDDYYGELDDYAKDEYSPVEEEGIVDVLSKHGKMNVNLNSDAAISTITNEIIASLDKKLICT